jgi:hypothetical protein
VGPPDTILEEDHPLTILSKFGSNGATGSRHFYVNFHQSFVAIGPLVSEEKIFM